MFRGVLGVFVCQTRLKLSWTVNECEPLRMGSANLFKFRVNNKKFFQDGGRVSIVNSMFLDVVGRCRSTL